MFRQQLNELLAECRAAAQAGLSLTDILSTIVLKDDCRILQSPNSFLEWVREDRELSFFYFDIQAGGACAKPKEAAAALLIAIVTDELEPDADS